MINEPEVIVEPEVVVEPEVIVEPEVVVEPEVTVETEVVVNEYPVVPPIVNTTQDSDFDHYEFNQNGRIDFSPEYYESLIKLYKNKKKLKDGEEGPSFTPTQAFAIQAATEFNARTGMGSYYELKNGTSKFQPGYFFTDEEILKNITTMEEKGFLDALATRAVENVPSAATLAAGFAVGKKIQNVLPKLDRPFLTGYPRVDKIIGPAQTAYIAAKAAIPFVTGFGSSIFSSSYGEPFGEFFLGDKTLAIPSSRSTMRAGESFADVISFSPFAFFADKAASNVITDYFSNRLQHSGFGRGFDFSGKGKSFGQQWKNALEVAKNEKTTPSIITTTMHHQ